MKNNSSIKTVVAVGIGAALFFVLGRFVAIPSPVPNTNISLQYAVLALLATMYGPVAGGLIGFIGHALIDLSWGGSPWWSWVITSAFVGVVIGLFAKKLDVQEGEFGKGKVAVFVVANVIAHVIGWVVVAPVLDILIYAEPANKVFAQGVFAAVSGYDAVYFDYPSADGNGSGRCSIWCDDAGRRHFSFVAYGTGTRSGSIKTRRKGVEHGLFWKKEGQRKRERKERRSVRLDEAETGRRAGTRRTDCGTRTGNRYR